jgi:hypothetical protein
VEPLCFIIENSVLIKVIFHQRKMLWIAEGEGKEAPQFHRFVGYIVDGPVRSDALIQLIEGTARFISARNPTNTVIVTKQHQQDPEDVVWTLNVACDEGRKFLTELPLPVRFMIYLSTDRNAHVDHKTV